MKRLLLPIAFATAAFAAPLAGSGAAPAAHASSSAVHVALQVGPSYKNKAGFANVNATATISYTSTGATVSITATQLPPPSAVKAVAYIVWVSGDKSARIGTLLRHGNQFSIVANVNLTNVTGIKVTAEHSAMSKSGNGPTVLSGSVG